MPNLPLEWLIPVVLIILWIINSFLRGNDEEKSKNRQRTSSESGERPTRRPTTDIDRFLDEVNRRRRESTERRPAPAVRERPAPASSRKPTPKPVIISSTRTVKPAARTLERAVEPSRVVKTAEVVDVLPVAAVLAATPVQASPSVAAPKRIALESPGESSPTAGDLLVAMLASPDGVQTAFILRELFGEPLCKRPRR